jgi:hypothetical protein
MERSNRVAAAVIGISVAVLLGLSVYALQARQNGNQNVDSSPTPFPQSVFAQRLVVPEGTPISVRLGTTLSTKTANVGDRFAATVNSPVRVENTTVIPAGAAVEGHVILAQQPGKASGRGHLQLEYDQVAFDGHRYDLDTRSRVYTSASGSKKDAEMIGGGAVAGGVLGGILGHSAGSAVEGAVIGGAAGTGASLLTRGPQLTLAAGRELTMTLDRDVKVVPPSRS